MAIVPNRNGVPISATTPLSDPHNPSRWEQEFNNNVVLVDASPVSIANGSQLLLAANPLRKYLSIYSPIGQANMAYGIIPLAAVNGAGAVPIYGGGGYEFSGKVATNAIYLWGVAGQKLTVWVA